MNTVELIAAAAPALKSVARGVDPSRFDDRTPCSAFTVKQLANHIAGFWGMTAAAARKREIQGGDPGADLVGDDPGTVISALIDEGVGAWREDGALEGKTRFGPGEYDAPFAAQVTLFEEVVHGWDLAAATGQRLDVPGEVAEAVLQIAQALCQPDRRGEGKPFGSEVAVPDPAPAFEKALGLTGRDPGWCA